jgi:hypothetical protein
MQSFALGDAAMSIPTSTLFIEDTDVMGPTSSSSLSQHPSLTQQITPAVDLVPPSLNPADENPDAGIGDFVKGFFAGGTTSIFQPKTDANVNIRLITGPINYKTSSILVYRRNICRETAKNCR